MIWRVMFSGLLLCLRDSPRIATNAPGTIIFYKRFQDTTMTNFNNAVEVRRFLKERGFLKVRIRVGHSPFGGRDLYFVKRTDLPEGVTVATSSNSQGTGFYSSDAGQTAKLIADLARVLEGTNARAEA